MPKDIFKLITSIGFCLFVGFAGSFFTTPAIDTWYTTLQKPFFNPPNWVFAPVWTVLYILMGIALYLVWRKGIKKKAIRSALQVFGIQLALNFFWSLIFFGLHTPLLALGEIMILWIAIYITIKKFYPINNYTAWLLLPYLLWVSFAAILNGAIVFLNK